jgi:zinc protease
MSAKDCGGRPPSCHAKESVAAATSADLRRIFAQRFRPDQVILVAVGDFDDAKMMEMVKAKFGAWKAPGEPPIPVLARPSSKPDHAVFVVLRPGFRSDHP